VRIEAANDDSRERIARYCTRAFALERLSVLPDGRIAYEANIRAATIDRRARMDIEAHHQGQPSSARIRPRSTIRVANARAVTSETETETT